MDSKRSPRGGKAGRKERPETAANKGHFKKGNSGRPKGAINKTTASVKAALIDAFEGMGGLTSLIAWGKSEPGEFYKLWAKILPQEISGPEGGPIPIFAHVRELLLAQRAAGGDGSELDPGRNGCVSEPGSTEAPATPAPAG